MNEQTGFSLNKKTRIAIYIAIIIIALIAVWIFVSSIMEYHALKDARENIANEIERTQQQIDKYNHDIGAEIDDKYVESIAKDELDLIYPDEVIIDD